MNDPRHAWYPSTLPSATSFEPERRVRRRLHLRQHCFARGVAIRNHTPVGHTHCAIGATCFSEMFSTFTCHGPTRFPVAMVYYDDIVLESAIWRCSSEARWGHGGHAPPKTFGEFVSLINLRCSVLFVCNLHLGGATFVVP